MTLLGANALGEGPKMSNLVALEHVWNKDADGEATDLAYARGDRIAEADVKTLKRDDVRMAEEGSRAHAEEFDPEAARRAVSHQNDEPGYVRVSEEDYAALLARVEALEEGAHEPAEEPPAADAPKDGDPADTETKEGDVKTETKDVRGPKDAPKDKPKSGGKS